MMDRGSRHIAAPASRRRTDGPLAAAAAAASRSQRPQLVIQVSLLSLAPPPPVTSPTGEGSHPADLFRNYDAFGVCFWWGFFLGGVFVGTRMLMRLIS